MPTTEHLVCCEVGVRIEANDAGEAAIDRFVGLTEEQGRELATTPGLTRSEVEMVLARLEILTGYGDASRWDGFADLDEGDLTVRIDYVQEA